LSNNRAVEVVGEGFAGGDGGAIGVGGSVAGGSSEVVIINTTIYSNSASTNGGGVHIDGGGGSGWVKNSIVANNTASVGANCSNINLVSQGNNLASDDSCDFDASGDLINTDPLLGPLADNGGGTLTHALLPGSPAVDAADNAACAAPPVSGVDQRGVSRPQGTTCDVGAVEATANLTLTKSSTSDRGNPVQPTEHLTYTIVVTNTGGLTATNALISDTTPSNTTFVAGSISLTPPGAGTPGTEPPTLASNLSIAPNQAVTVTFAVTVNAPLLDGTLITNTASLTSTETPGPVSDSVTDAVITDPILSIGKSSQDVNGDELVPGDTIIYTVVVTNSGADATNGVISDTVPANTSFVPGSISLNPPGVGTAGVTPPVLADDLTIYANESVTVAFAVTVNKPLNAGTVIANTVSLTTTQTPLPLTDSVANTVSTTPAINVAKDGPSNASVDETAVYTFTVTNVGNTLLENVQVVDDYAGPANYVGGDDGDLKLGLTEAWVYTASYTIQPSDPEPLINTVSVTATDALNTPTTDTDQHSTGLSELFYLPLIMKVFGP
jgi:uncharacterized repeat protein (TIGR01451 family)